MHISGPAVDPRRADTVYDLDDPRPQAILIAADEVFHVDRRRYGTALSGQLGIRGRDIDNRIAIEDDADKPPAVLFKRSQFEWCDPGLGVAVKAYG